MSENEPPKTENKKPAPKRAMTEKQKDKIAQHAHDVDKVSAVTAKMNLTPAPYNRALTDPMIEAILVRVAAGETVKHVCEDFGVSSGVLYSRASREDWLGERLQFAMRISTNIMVDNLATIALDPTIPVDRARLHSDNMKWITSKRNRAVYGDKLTVEKVDRMTVVWSNDDDDLV